MIAFIKSVFTNKCPRCRKSSLFVKPLNIAKPLAMNKTCANCNLDFEPAPGYYYGAMFLSYIIGSFIILPAALFLVFGLKMSVESAMIVVVILGIVLFLKLLRGSRALWIHMNIKYEGEST